MTLSDAYKTTTDKKIVFTGGGTGGHVYPNVALFDDFVKAGFSIVYIGANGNSLEGRLAKEHGVKFFGIDAVKLARSFSPQAVKTISLSPSLSQKP